MAIQDSDFLLIDDDGVVKKVRADKLKADRDNGTNLYSNKKLLINKGNFDSHFVYFSDLDSKIANIAWMVIGSNGQTYKTSTVQIADYFGLNYTPPADITTEFVEISQRVIYPTSSHDYPDPWDVSEIAMSRNITGRIYLGAKITSGSGSNSQYNDICIAGVQIVRSGSLVASWIFNTNTGGTGSGWQTTYSLINGTIEHGIGGRTPADLADYPYQNISQSTDRYRFSWGSGTSSSFTGYVDGIGTEYQMPSDGGSGTIVSTGEGTVPQTNATFYAYREGDRRTYNYWRRRWLYYYAQNYSTTVMRSPEFTFETGDIIKVIHGVTGVSSRPINPDDSLYIGIN